MRQSFFGLLAVLLLSAGIVTAGSPSDAIWEYVQARSQQEKLPYTVDVTITAAIPSIGKVGRLRAIRHQAGQGRFNYDSMQFEGDSVIKTNVIARYLSAELEAQRPEEKLATQISPANYQFKLKGREPVEGREALVFEVKPYKKRPGLFRGQVWIDSETRQPLKETGKLAKLPSVWVKEISFTREYKLAQGVALPSCITSQVKTRIVGQALITVDFQNYRFPSEPEPQPAVALGQLPDAAIPSSVTTLSEIGALQPR